MNQFTFTLQRFRYRRIRFVDMNASKLASSVRVDTIRLYKVERFKVITVSDDEVIHTVIRRSMNRTGTRISGYVITQNNGYFTIEYWVFQLQQLQRRTVHTTQHFELVDAPAFHDRLNHRFSKNLVINTAL